MGISEQEIKTIIQNSDPHKLLVESPRWTVDFIIKFFQSQLFRDIVFYTKIIFVFLSCILFYAIVLLYIKSEPVKRFRKYYKGTAIKDMPKGKTQRAWNKVQKRLTTMQEAEYKMAVIEAEKIFDNILLMIGYKGNTLGDRLKTMRREQLECIEEIWSAHKVRNRIVHNPDEKISLSEAQDAVGKFEVGIEELIEFDL
ncbi:hypothetical protein D4R87_01680 [bacterium]|nr:MAG: hypothetical protein D4R87_01680 [bacterium]